MSPSHRSHHHTSDLIEKTIDKNDPGIIVALDYANEAAAMALVAQLDPALCRLKVGKELFTAVGPSVIGRLHELGFQVFLDMKFHDIPNTVAKAVKAAADLGVWMVNIHVSGGVRMMVEARDILTSYQTPPLLVGVTVLTSLEKQDLQEIGIEIEPSEWVLQLAAKAKSSGLDGVVCSAQESPKIKHQIDQDFVCVTPGIRLPQQVITGNENTARRVDDQRRTVTPTEAIMADSDFLVVGRPITQADSPGEALHLIYQECVTARSDCKALNGKAE